MTEQATTIPEPLSDPMSVRDLAKLFGMGRDKMGTVLEAMPGAERFGGKWRIPVSKMPIEWLLDVGLIFPQAVDLSAIQGQLSHRDSADLRECES